MTRRRVLILAAAVALLLLAVDVRSLFAAHSLHRLVAWLWALCSRLTEPLPMALVTLGTALAMPRDDARLPVVVNLAAALLMGAALSWGNKPHFLGGLLRLTPEAAGAMYSICFYAFLLWAARRYCAARAAPRGAYGAAGRCPGVCRTRPAGRAALSFERAGRGGGNGDLSVAFDGPCAQAKRKGRSLKTRRAPSLRPMPPGGRLLMRAFPFCPCPDRLPECSCC